MHKKPIWIVAACLLASCGTNKQTQEQIVKVIYPRAPLVCEQLPELPNKPDADEITAAQWITLTNERKDSYCELAILLKECLRHTTNGVTVIDLPRQC